MTQILYKVTDGNHKTRNDTQWGPNVTHGPTSGQGPLCSSEWLHAYKSAKDAALMHRYHVDFDNYVLWEAEGTIGKEGTSLKIGTTVLKTIRIIDFPEITSEDIDRYLDDEDWRVRRMAIKHHNATSEHINRALNDEYWDVRYWAIRRSNPNKMLNDENWDIGEAAFDKRRRI